MSGVNASLVVAGLAPNAPRKFGVLRYNLDDFLSKIDDFEI